MAVLHLEHLDNERQASSTSADDRTAEKAHLTGGVCMELHQIRDVF